MSMPENVLSSEGVTGTFLYPDNLAHTALLDYEMGGAALNSGLDGLQVQVWTCFYTGGGVRVRPLGDAGAGTLIFSRSGITKLSFSFDRAMRVVVAYLVGTQGYLYWYDTIINQYVTTNLGTIRCPRVTHDDKRLRADQTSDVLVAFIRNDSLCVLTQRDRYTIERIMATGIPEEADLIQAGMTDRLRVEFKVEVP